MDNENTNDAPEQEGLSLEDIEHVTVVILPGTPDVKVMSSYPYFDPGAAILMMKSAIAQLELIDRLNFRFEQSQKKGSPNLLLPSR